MSAPQVIHVTAEHIAGGKRCDGSACPIAQALHDELGGLPARDVFVTDAEASIWLDRKALYAELPDVARGLHRLLRRRGGG